MFRYSLVLSLCVAWGAAALAEWSELGDPNPLFTGTTVADSADFTATVDYAVFWPDHFTATNSTALNDPDGVPFQIPDASAYVYVYQISLSNDSQPVSTLGLNVQAASSISGVGVNDTGDPSTWVSPSYAFLNDTPGFGVIEFWFSSPNQLEGGETSYYMLYSSTLAPTFAQAGITNGGFPVDIPGGLPSPVIPAPGAALLGVIGLSLIGPLKRRLS